MVNSRLMWRMIVLKKVERVYGERLPEESAESFVF